MIGEALCVATMKVYLDMCALKRPFDNQSQGRIWLESRAVTRVLRAFAAGAFTVCNSSALEFEVVDPVTWMRRLNL